MSRVVTTPTWSVDGWTGNAVDDNGVEWLITSDSGWFDPLEVRSSDVDKSVADGTWSSPNTRAQRVITLAGTATALDYQSATIDAAADQFASLLAGVHLTPLVVAETARTLQADVKLGPSPKLLRTSWYDFDFQFTMIAPDPLKYGTLLTSSPIGLQQDADGGVRWNGSDGASGLQWNGSDGASGVQWQGTPGSSGVLLLDNVGTAPAPVTWTVTGPITQPSIVDAATGRTLTFGDSIVGAQTLVLDGKSHSVRLDGIGRKALLTRRDWFSVPRKTTGMQVLFKAPQPAPGALLVASWRPAYY